ncbi:hypothetical protein THARTR1_08921 [Trichoderma harzianum]|uniref:Uncharacterized protein n=1 Tax=Trichoderma harzianum TaxID=5544 RepID=A0A2K0TY02_TRIHA|nr:hypothetical protein THARTR1_08921 [Trichoderma harzianum]
MDSRYPRLDSSQLTILPSSNFKRAGSGSRWASTPHKARGITEVSNRNTISKDSTQSNELWALELRNRATISKDLTQSDGPIKSKMQNREATSKEKIENDNPRMTALDPGGSLNSALDMSMFRHSLDRDFIGYFRPANYDGSLPDKALALREPVPLNRRSGVPDWDSMQTDSTKLFPMGAMPPNASPDLHAVHQPSPAQEQLIILQQQQYFQQQRLIQQFKTYSPSVQMAAIRQQQIIHQQQQRQVLLAQQLQIMGAAGVNGMPTPQQLHQLRQRNAAAGSGHVSAQTLQAATMSQHRALQQRVAQQQAEQQRAAMGRT